LTDPLHFVQKLIFVRTRAILIRPKRMIELLLTCCLSLSYSFTWF